MRNKFFHAMLLCTLIVSSHLSNAGLVIGNQEFLDLKVTNSQSLYYMNRMIANDSSLAGYQMATDVDMAMLFNMFPIGDNKNNPEPYYLVASNGNQKYSALIDFFLGSGYIGGKRPIPTPRISTDMNGVVYTHDQLYQGTISYLDTSASNVQFASGRFKARVNSLGEEVAIFSYKNPPTGRSGKYDLGNSNTSTGDYTRYLYQDDSSSLWVRTVQVDAPSTLAILALGMIGLASRRFKKQS
jgi:hypothetical protein